MSDELRDRPAAISKASQPSSSATAAWDRATSNRRKSSDGWDIVQQNYDLEAVRPARLRRRVGAGRSRSSAAPRPTSPIARLEHDAGSAGAVSQPFAWSSASSWPGPPAGIAEREERLPGAVAARHVLEDVDRRRHREVADDVLARLLDRIVVGVEHEAAPVLDRPAEVHARPREVDRRRNFQLGQKVGEARAPAPAC